jgi:hypothetical protein
LLGGEKGITGLCHGREESIQAADIVQLSSDAEKFVVKLLGLSTRELSYCVNAEQIEIAYGQGPTEMRSSRRRRGTIMKNPP